MKLGLWVHLAYESYCLIIIGSVAVIIEVCSSFAVFGNTGVNSVHRFTLNV